MKGDGWVFLKRQRFWIGYYHAGKEHREPALVPDQKAPQGRRPAASEAEAQKVLRLTIRRLDRGEHVTPDKRRLTVGELLDGLLEWMRNQGKRSVDKLASHVKSVRERLGAVRAAAVTTVMVERYKTARIKEGKAAATVNREVEGLRRAFTWGAQQTPPLVPHVPTMHRLVEDNAREGFLSRADFEGIVAHVQDPDVRDFIEWGFWTGMRKGEIAKLTWEAFDRETWALRLPARSAKTRRGRVLSLTGPLRTIMERRLSRRLVGCSLIFHRFSKGKAGQPIKDFRLAWAAACKAAGIKPGRKDGITFHDTRRTAARNLTRAGVDRSVAKKITGHVTDSMFERYNITDEEDLADAGEKLDAYVQGPPTGANPDRSRTRGLPASVSAQRGRGDSEGYKDELAEAGGNRTHRCRGQPAAGRL